MLSKAIKPSRKAGLINLVWYHCWIVIDSSSVNMNRRGTEPYARWCERTGVVKLPPTRLSSSKHTSTGLFNTSLVVKNCSSVSV